MGVVLEKNRLLHASPKRKKAYGHALRIEEFKQVVDVLEEQKEVYVDTDKKNIVFVFDDVEDDEKINKIVVEFEYKVKKFGKINAVVTMGKVGRTKIKDKKYKKIKE